MVVYWDWKIFREKFFNWIGSNKIPRVWVISTRCFPSLLKFVFPPFPTSSISFWKCNLRWQMCVRRKTGFRLSQLSSSYISAWRLRWFWVVFQKEKEKLICHPKIQMLKRRWKSKSTPYYSCLLIGSLYLNPLLFLYISLPSRHIPIRRRP